MVSDRAIEREKYHSNRGIHFHVSITPTEFQYIQNEFNKHFENKVESLAIISHQKYYYDLDKVKQIDKELDNFIQFRDRDNSFENLQNLILRENEDQKSYFFLSDQDVSFGALEITWTQGFKFLEHKTRITTFLKNIFSELKTQVFDLYFENLYPLLMSRIHELEREIIEKEKSELAVDLIEGIAHSVANPLSIIYANLEITEEILMKNTSAKFNKEANKYSLEVDSNEFDELGSIFEDQKEAVRRITNVISELRIFSRAYKGEIENVDLNNVLKLSLNFSQLRLKLRDRIVLKLNSTARVYSSLFIVSQVMYNILKIIINTSPTVSEKIYITTEDGENETAPSVIIKSVIKPNMVNLAKFSFIDNFMLNIPHTSNIEVEDDLIIIIITHNTFSYLS